MAATRARRCCQNAGESDESLAPIPYTVLAQPFAALLAGAEGLNPDEARSRSEVTRRL